MSNGKRAAPFSAFSETILGKIWADVKDIVRNTLDDLKKADKKRLVLMNLPYVAFAYVCNKIVYLYRISEGISGTEKVVFVINHFDKAFANPLPSLVPKDVLYGIAGGIVFKLIMYYKAKNAKKFRHGVEYGSARWGNAKDIKPYVDPVFENNIILTQTEFLMMSGRPKQPKYARNKNVLVVGGSGSGKTRFFIKPNLMQMHSSYVVTDPKGTVLVECGKLLARGKPKLDDKGQIVKDKKGKIVFEPYKIKVLNTINFKKSMHYNPFVCIRSEKDILKLVSTIIANTKGEGQQSGEDFWVSATCS